MDNNWKISLRNPFEDNYAYLNYEYVLTPVFSPADGVTSLKVYVTNPNNESENLTLSVGEYYTIRTFLTGNFLPTSMPRYDYETLGTTAEWKLPNGTTTLFTTDNVNLIGYKLLGYTIQRYDSTGSMINTITLLFEDSAGKAIGGAHSYELYPIWEDRYYVEYYDNSATPVSLSKVYYDKDTVINVDSNSTKYADYTDSGVKYKFVGYASLPEKAIQSTDDFVIFGEEIVLNTNYTFYPAFAMVYTVVFNDSSDTLSNSENKGDASNISGGATGKTLEVYLGMPYEVLTTYFDITYNGVGYSFAGFTLHRGVMANAIGTTVDGREVEIFTGLVSDKSLVDYYANLSTHVLDISDIVSNELTIYVAWERASYTVTFSSTAKWNDGTNANVLLNPELTYLHNEAIDFEDTRIQNYVYYAGLTSHFEFAN